jgi:hypothetical protein
MKLLIAIIILIIILSVFYWFNYKNMTFLLSPIDNHYYMVRDLPDKYIAVNMLSTLRKNILTFIEYLNSKKDNEYKEYEPYITQLTTRMKGVVISENKEHTYTTSYSVNKGEELVFCLRSKKVWDKFHDINVLMYVVLHEISHIACPEYGHTDLFKKIFAFFTKIAIELKQYTYINFTAKPEEYCGIYITDSII